MLKFVIYKKVSDTNLLNMTSVNFATNHELSNNLIYSEEYYMIHSEKTPSKGHKMLLLYNFVYQIYNVLS